MADTIKLASSCFMSDIEKIYQIGCGGTGSLLVPHLARALARGDENKALSYTLIDGDEVSEKNLQRQNFIAPDIGLFKSDVLAKRYSLAFGKDIISEHRYITDSCESVASESNALIISCVDNNRTRKIIHDKFKMLGIRGEGIWIDAGNELFGGQIFIQGFFSTWDGMYFSTNILTIHPEIGDRKDKLPTEMSCAERVNSGIQSLGVNLTAATILFNVANSFIRKQKVCYYEIDFTAKNSFKKKMLDDYPMD